ncbi:MAG: alpha/beta hydrolase [Defluviitaleaceae bacterium]|nr:alpha/beta hydrolase [Defluviitaleaceae bacterium]
MTQKKALITLSTISAFILALLILLPIFVMSLFWGQRYYQYQHSPATFGVEALRITLTTYDGLDLAAWRTHAVTEMQRGTVIIVSGLQEPSVTAFFGYANMLAQNGWDALLIEKRARSLSQGDEIGFGITEWQDVKAGVYYLNADERAGHLPIVAMGTSAGGATVIIAGGEVPRIDGVIAISAYSNFTSLYVDGISMMGLPRFVGVITTPIVHLRMRLRFGHDATSHTPENGIAKLGQRPILLMHSTNDRQVLFSHFERLRQTADDNNINFTTFVREGDWHFVCYDWYITNPARDIKFTAAIIAFLDDIYFKNLAHGLYHTPTTNPQAQQIQPAAQQTIQTP